MRGILKLVCLMFVLCDAARANAAPCPAQLRDLDPVAHDGCTVSDAGLKLAKTDVVLASDTEPDIERDKPGDRVLKATNDGVFGFYLTDKEIVLLLTFKKKTLKIEGKPTPKCVPLLSSLLAEGKREGYCWLGDQLLLNPPGKRGDKPVEGLTPAAVQENGTPVVQGTVEAVRFHPAADGNAVILLLKSLSEEQPAPKKPAEKETPEATPDARDCTNEDYIMPETHAARQRIVSACKDEDYFCVTPSGQVLHQPELVEGKQITVAIVHPKTDNPAFELELEFKRAQLLVLSLGPKEHNADWIIGDHRSVVLSSAGTLRITVRVRPLGSSSKLATTDGKNCVQKETLEKELSYDVTGHYHFMTGIMPTYAGLFSRTHTLHRSDDGVQRVLEQDVREVDWVFTLTGYPFGVSENDFAGVGLLVGTSVRDIGKRWYAGIELATPIGLGMVAGGGLIVVPELDQEFMVGQPFSGTQVPAHNTAVPTWFVGINVQAQLFSKAFKGIAGDDDD